jgi:hypothetical protein
MEAVVIPAKTLVHIGGIPVLLRKASAHMCRSTIAAATCEASRR